MPQRRKQHSPQGKKETEYQDIQRYEFMSYGKGVRGAVRVAIEAIVAPGRSFCDLDLIGQIVGAPHAQSPETKMSSVSGESFLDDPVVRGIIEVTKGQKARPHLDARQNTRTAELYPNAAHALKYLAEVRRDEAASVIYELFKEALR